MAYPFGGTAPTRRDQYLPKFSRFSQALRRYGGGRRNPSYQGTPRARADAAETPRVLFESLEQRYLLSADISPLTIAMADVGNDLTVKFTGSQIEVISDASGQV